MKKWFRFFCLSFFSNDISKEGAKRGYTNVFLGLLLAFALIWAGFVGGDMLPFSAHYGNSPDFVASVHAVLANPDVDKRISIEIEENLLKAKKQGGEYTEALLVNTFENDADRLNYSVNGYNVVVDSRPADTLAEVEAYCISNDGKSTIISYRDYLTLSDVAKLNFDFKLTYTGKAFELSGELVEGYRSYLDGLGDEIKGKAEELRNDLAENTITESEYNRSVYELYFENYYPEITAYESTSKVPLLRNYYYHRYIEGGNGRYLFIFDDYLAGSFETAGGVNRSFYGFYSDMENGVLVSDGAGPDEASRAADDFIIQSYASMAPLTMYAYAMNVFSLIPFIALMPMVVTLLAYSILKLGGIDSLTSLGGTFKIIGSYVWFSALISATASLLAAFFVESNVLSALPLLIFFVALAARSIVFSVMEVRSYIKQSEQQEKIQTEA